MSRLRFLIVGVALGAAAVIGVTGGEAAEVVTDSPTAAIAFLLLTVALQGLSVPVPRGGRIGVSAIAVIATGISLGTGAAVAVALTAGFAQWAYSRGKLHRAVFDAAQFTLAAALSTLVYGAIVSVGDGVLLRVLGAFAAGVCYAAVNNGLLCTAIGIDSGLPPLVVWRQRFAAARFHYLAFGPLALAAAVVQEQFGFLWPLVVAVPAFVLAWHIRRVVHRLRVAQPLQEHAA